MKKRFSISGVDATKNMVNQGEGERGNKSVNVRRDEANPGICVTEPPPLWGKLYANDAEIVSRRWKNILAKMLKAIVTACASFRVESTVPEVKTETKPMCLVTKDEDRFTLGIEAAGSVYTQTGTFELRRLYLRAATPLSRFTATNYCLAYVSDNVVAWKYSNSRCDRPTVPLLLKVRLFMAKRVT